MLCFTKPVRYFSKSFVSECPRGYKWLPTTSPGKGFLIVGYAIFSFTTYSGKDELVLISGARQFRLVQLGHIELRVINRRI
jgi:hypothetical protein